jgi:polysaccharide export outer membrane protein
MLLRGLLAALVLSLAVPAIPAMADPESPDSAAMDWTRVPEYRIVPGDVLRFNFGPDPQSHTDTVREARVRPDGRISVYPVGELIAAGRTIAELQTAMVQLMSGEFRLPRVAIELFEAAGNSVHVFGRVRTPGTYKVTPFMTVSQAIADAGGFEEDAASNSVLVFHRDGARTVRVSRVQLHRSLKRASLEGDLPLSRFDIIFVPRSTIGNIDIFAKQFFNETSPFVLSPKAGWELFHLDRVFVVSSTIK